MKIAYCRDCRIAIAAGALAPQRTFVIMGKRKVVSTMPSHTVKGEQHRNVGLLDVPDQHLPTAARPEEMEAFFKDLTKKYKADFK